MSRPLAEFEGEALYLDTTVFYALVRNIEPNVVKPLFRRIRSGNWRGFTSVLTFDELAYRLLLGLIRDHYPGSPLDQLRRHEEQMITEFYPRIVPELEQLRNFPNFFLLDVTATDLRAMDEAVLRFSLRPRDGLHYAAMQKANCFDLVSEDSDFDRVSGIQRYYLTS